MPEDLAPEVAQTSPEPEESSTPALETTIAAQGPDSPPASAEPQRKQRASERIAELSAEKAALREAAEYWREVATQSTPIPVAPAQPDPRPTLEQFDHDQDKWADAYSDWSDRRADTRAEARVDKAFRERDSANEVEASRARWQDNSLDFAEKHPDFDAVISNPTLKISKDMLDVFQDSDKGPDIAYHLGKNPDVAAKIARLPRNKMALAIGRLERDLSTPKPQPTNAPQPPNPVGGQQPTINPGEMGIDDWVEHRREELRQQGRR